MAIVGKMNALAKPVISSIQQASIKNQETEFAVSSRSLLMGKGLEFEQEPSGEAASFIWLKNSPGTELTRLDTLRQNNSGSSLEWPKWGV